MIELTPKQIRALPTAALKLVQHDLRTKLVPDAMRHAQGLQRSLLWIDRELKRRAHIPGRPGETS